MRARWFGDEKAVLPVAARCVLAGLLMAAGIGPSIAAAEERAPRSGSPAGEPFRIVALGSSSTQGVGASTPAAVYPARLARLFDDVFHGRPSVSVINRGVGGEDIDDMIGRLDRDVVSSKPDLVIWQVGSNDPLRGVPLVRFEAELRSGISRLRASGAEVMLMEPQLSPKLASADAANRFVDAVRAIGSEQHVDVVRRYDLMRRWLSDGRLSQGSLIGPDGLHMTDQGYALLAKAVFDLITTDSPAFKAREVPAAAPNHS